MKKLFYDHVIVLDVFIAKLNEHGVDAAEKEKILAVVDKILHHELLDVILFHLPREHHEVFLESFHAKPSDRKHLHFLITHAHPEIETLLQKRVNEILDSVMEDLVSASESGG